jgi:Fic-DOC domain mobile mystery protein B
MEPEAGRDGDPLAPELGARLALSLSTWGQLRAVERVRINEARAWAARAATLARPDLLTEGFCRELHRRMFGGVWRRAGRYRTAGGGPGWEPARIAEGVALVMDDAEAWIRFSTYPVHEAAVRIHHRLRSVRPWQVGNARHARLLADVVVAAAGEAPLGWGASLAGDSPREHYRRAAGAADRGDFTVLVQFAVDAATR